MDCRISVSNRSYDRLKTVFFSKRQISDSSKVKEFADDNLKFVEIGGKFSKLVENTVGKEEIARCEQFLLFPHFQCTEDT